MCISNALFDLFGMYYWIERKGFSIITEFMGGRKDRVCRELLALERIWLHEWVVFFSFSLSLFFSFFIFSLILTSLRRRFYALLHSSKNAYATLYDRRTQCKCQQETNLDEKIWPRQTKISNMTGKDVKFDNVQDVASTYWSICRVVFFSKR